MMTPHPAHVALLVLAVALVPRGTAAQHVVEGRVLDAADGMPIEDATIRVVGEGLVLGTDTAGAFSFRLPEDRPGVALEIEVIGFRPFNRTWLLPLDRPLTIGLEQDVIPLAGIDVEVERSGMTPPERLEYRVRSVPGGIPRTATARALRSFPDQRAEILDFLPEMTVATGAGCESCLMMAGRFDPDRWIVDDREVVFDEFRMLPVGDICRIDIVVVPVAGSPMEKGSVLAYTCDFLRRVATGEVKLQLLMTTLWGRD